MTNTPTSDDRLMAVLAHASVVIFGPGILVGFIVWFYQREKETYASRQGLQAAVYQLIGMIVTMGLWTLWGIFYALTWIPLITDIDQYSDAPPPIFWIGLASMIIPLLGMLAWTLYGLWGALKCYQGQDFRYLVIGKMLNPR